MTDLPEPFAACAEAFAQELPWHALMQARPLHPVVVDLLKRQPLPRYWQTIVLDWPHVSQEDAEMLAYTPNEAKALKGIVVNLSPAKYVRKHWHDLSDHTIRDTVARVANEANFRWLTTSDDMVRGVQEGPGSCMRWKDHEEYDEDGALSEPHPYRVYAPELGWSMAIRLGPGGRIDARALVYRHPAHGPGFVRSFRRCFDCNGNEDYSQADEALEAWLCNNGVEKLDGWYDGTKLAKIPRNRTTDKPLAPYLDGATDRFNIMTDHLRIEEGGRYEADHTNGGYGQCGDWRTCSHCGEEFDADDDEHIYTGPHQENVVGGCCAEDFTFVRGRDRRMYYIHDDDIVWVGANAYDGDYLEDNDIVELADGEYAHVRDAVHSPWDDYWHLRDACVQTEDEGWVPREDVWQCQASGKWYSTNTAPVEIDDAKYHPDFAPEREEEDDEEAENPFDAPSTTADVYAQAA